MELVQGLVDMKMTILDSWPSELSIVKHRLYPTPSAEKRSMTCLTCSL
jgi:hypothetical protein